MKLASSERTGHSQLIPGVGPTDSGSWVFRVSGYYFIGLLAAAVAAFWPKYIARPFSDIDAYTHVHAAAMVTWCGLLIAQPFLVRARRLSLHRALGVLSYGVAPAVVVSSVLLAHYRFRSMDDDAFRAEARNLYLPLSAILLFAVAYTCGISYRRTPALHARFMICTSLTMMDPVLGRVLAFYFPPLPRDLYYQAVTYGSADAILLVLAIADRHRPQSRWVFPIMLALFMTAHVLWFSWAQSDAWLLIASWFRRVPLT
jgi:hypothetical protein